MNTITIKSTPVDRSAIFEDKNRMREAIFTFGCYCPDMTFTLSDVVTAFGYRKDKAWLRIGELRRSGRVRLLNQTRNRSVQYRIATKENA